MLDDFAFYVVCLDHPRRNVSVVVFTSLVPPSKKCRAGEAVRHGWGPKLDKHPLWQQRFLCGNPSFSGCKFQVLGMRVGSQDLQPLTHSWYHLWSMLSTLYIKLWDAFGTDVWQTVMIDSLVRLLLRRKHGFQMNSPSPTGLSEKCNLDPLLGERFVSKSIYLSHLCDSKAECSIKKA